jgi:hypothetical protein
MPALSRTLGREALAEYLRRGYTRFYMRPGYILKKLGTVRSPRDIIVLARQARTVVNDYILGT